VPGETVLVIDDSPTILKVVQLVLTKAGFNVRTALDGEQGVEVAREKRPDLILLDFVMPKMNGYQVCRALTDDDTLKDVPVVLMSAKGDQVGERFVKVMGIVDYITKPFSPDAITAVVTHTIAKYAKPIAEAAGPVATAAPQAAAPQVMLSASGSQAIIDTSNEDARRQALETLRQTIARAVAGRLAENGDTDSVALRAAQALPDDALETMIGSLRTTCPELIIGPDVVLTGDLRVIPLAEVLQLLHLQAQSGVLSIARPGSKAEIFFRTGRVELATQAGVSEEFLIGRFVLEQNLMSKQDLDLLLASRKEASGWLLGRQLVKLGYVSETDLKQVISKQTCEIVYEVLRWNFGRFVFRPTKDLPAIAVEAALGLSVEGILMEGFRRVDEWHLIEREIDNFDVVFLRNEDALTQIGRGRLTREELAVLELVNGKNTVKEIIRQSRMGSFDVTKMLYRLLSIKVLRRREMPVAV
jgi:DNA-binding response OmpR family regulator